MKRVIQEQRIRWNNYMDNSCFISHFLCHKNNSQMEQVHFLNHSQPSNSTILPYKLLSYTILCFSLSSVQCHLHSVPWWQNEILHKNLKKIKKKSAIHETKEIQCQKEDSSTVLWAIYKLCITTTFIKLPHIFFCMVSTSKHWRLDTTDLPDYGQMWEC
jgi:hypothetical protein